MTKDELRGLDGYVIGPRLAVGGHSEVFAARAIATSEDVVLKVPLPEVAKNPSYVEAVTHEAALGRLVSHRALVRVVALVERDSGPVLVLERVDGITLADALDACRARGTHVPIDVAVHVARELLDALATLHEAKDESGRALGVVHRDVGPRNVLLARDGSVKLVDLGIARSRLRDARTRTGVVRGTLRYLAPEQATGSPVDARTDLYAVGLLLFELATGEPFLAGENEIELLRAAEDPRPRAIGAGASVELEAVVARALARFPEERFATARGFERALAPFAAEGDAARSFVATLVSELSPPAIPREDTTGAGSAREPSTQPTRIRRVAIVTGLAVVAGLAFATPFVRRQATPRHEPAPATPATRATYATDRGNARATRETFVETNPAGSVPNERVSTPVRSLSPSSATPPRTAPPRVRTEPARSAEPRDETTAPVPIPVVAVAPTPPAVTPEAVVPGPIEPVDRASVERKLRRANDALRAARGRGESTDELDALARGALEAFVEGRYDVADARLERILSRVPPR